MSLYHAWISHILPFSWGHYQFMQNALLAVLIVSPLLALMGTMVVNNKMAFFSDSIGHSTLTGLAIGVMLGMGNPLWAMLIFAAGLAVLISLVKNATRFSADTIIGVFASTAVALGVLLLSMGGGFNKYTRFLIGDLLSITDQELILLLGVSLVVIVVWLYFYNRLLLGSINPSLATSRGIRVQALDTLFSVLLAVTVTLSIQWVGILIINSLLVLPAATARNLASDMRQYSLIAIGTGLFAGLTGLVASFYLDAATGATIVLISSLLFAASLILKRS